MDLSARSPIRSFSQTSDGLPWRLCHCASPPARSYMSSLSTSRTFCSHSFALIHHSTSQQIHTNESTHQTRATLSARSPIRSFSQTSDGLPCGCEAVRDCAVLQVHQLEAT